MVFTWCLGTVYNWHLRMYCSRNTLLKVQNHFEVILTSIWHRNFYSHANFRTGYRLWTQCSNLWFSSRVCLVPYGWINRWAMRLKHAKHLKQAKNVRQPKHLNCNHPETRKARGGGKAPQTKKAPQERIAPQVSQIRKARRWIKAS